MHRIKHKGGELISKSRGLLEILFPREKDFRVQAVISGSAKHYCVVNTVRRK